MPRSTLKQAEVPTVVARAAELAHELKAYDVIALDLRGISSATDFFLLASGNSDVQVKAIAEHISEELRRDGARPNHIEGLPGGGGSCWTISTSSCTSSTPRPGISTSSRTCGATRHGGSWKMPEAGRIAATEHRERPHLAWPFGDRVVCPGEERRLI